MEADIFDPDYVQKQQVANLRRMAAEQNALRVQTYQGQCRTWIEVNLRNRDLGLELSPVPAVPKKILVDEAGEWRESAFEGLAAPSLPPQVVEERKTSIKAPADKVGPDRLDQTLACLQALNDKLEKVLALLGKAA